MHSTEKTRVNWRNPYIDKVSLEQRFIIPFSKREFTESDQAKLNSKLSQYQHLILELGCGSGKFLAELALKNPEALCLGFELRYKRVFSCAKRATKAALENILLLRTNAADIERFAPLNSVDAIYVNFPDPWEKTGWLKNRLLNSDFFNKVSRVLKPDATFCFKSDHSGYFDSVLQLIESDKRFALERVSRDLHISEWKESNILTEFEMLFKSKGVKVNYLLARLHSKDC